MSRITKGYWIAIIGTVIWSTTAIIIRHLTLQYQIPPLVLAFWRDLFASIALLVGLLVFGRKYLKINKKDWFFLAAYGFVLSLYNSLWTISVGLNGAAVSTVLAYSSPAFTTLLAWKILDEKLTWGKFGLVLLSFAGCILVAGAYSPDLWKTEPIGIITGLLSGLIFAVYSLMGKASANRGINSWMGLCVIFAFAAFFLFIYNLVLPDAITGHPAHSVIWANGDLQGWLWLALLALVPTIGGYGLYNLSLHYLPAGTSNLIATTEPVFTGILAWFILKERFTTLEIIGSLLILCAVFLMRIFFEFGKSKVIQEDGL